MLETARDTLTIVFQDVASLSTTNITEIAICERIKLALGYKSVAKSASAFMP